LEAVSSNSNLRTHHAVVKRDPSNVMMKTRRMSWVGHVASIGLWRESQKKIEH
jgi:hypothetical protein